MTNQNERLEQQYIDDLEKLSYDTYLENLSVEERRLIGKRVMRYCKMKRNQSPKWITPDYINPEQASKLIDVEV